MDVLFLLHGFNVSDGGKSSTDKLKSYLKADTIIDDDYGYTLLSVKFVDIHKAQQLAKDIIDNKILGNRVFIIGHSNGCTIIYKALERITKYFPDQIIFINPALKSSIEFPKGNYKASVFYSHNDLATKLAGLFSFIPNSLYLWGDMGNKGYTGIKDKRILNYNEESYYTLMTGKQLKFGHSTIFEDDILAYFGPFINEIIHG